MYFASSPKHGDVATSNFAGAYNEGHMMQRVMGIISCDLDPLDLGQRSNNVFSCK